MGAAATKELQGTPVGKAFLSPSDAIDGTVLTAPRSVKTRSTRGCAGRWETIVEDAASGAAMYMVKTRVCAVWCTFHVFDPEGHLVCVAKGKRQLTTASFRVLRPSPAFAGQTAVDAVDDKSQGKHEGALISKNGVPLFAFAEGKISMGLATASCEYNLVTKSEATPLYHAKKLRTAGLALRVESPDGTLVGKIAAGMIPSSKTAHEIGKGVDPLAVILVSFFISQVMGTGGDAIGGLAGAGAI